MRRSLVLLAAVLALAALPARAGEPLDLDLTRLGAPAAAAWAGVAGCTDASQCAAGARIRFARRAPDLALAFSSSLLQPASTTGASGWDFDLETGYATVKHQAIAGGGYSQDYWATRSTRPSELLLPSFHVRKAFPYSVELGGRVIYLSQSLYFATQLEGKVAFLEGYRNLPDVALRVAWTRMAGQRDLSVATTEFDLMASWRTGLSAAVSLTPDLALRYSLLGARTSTMLFGSDPAAAGATAAFPALSSQFYRTTLGVRMTAAALSLAAELTYFGGASGGQATADEAKYPKYSVPASLSGAFKLGFEF
jgi:hypothetical protein